MFDVLESMPVVDDPKLARRMGRGRALMELVFEEVK
jgi:hypothetical protein